MFLPRTKSNPTPYTVSNASCASNVHAYPASSPSALLLMLKRMLSNHSNNIGVALEEFYSTRQFIVVQFQSVASSCSRMYLTNVFLWV